ncbi:DUF397 domain-containing protein [Streptomyces zagrosensis]|uniref:Putative secreted Zn-dependent protease n=1 Tax=Streptomyces zagrosensis TaxID=1042984 RepID=A0A7W9V2C0_9ACTN|nr:DUF397 domain-containing protein [Streptomyces zagrosensis]MBB5940125.1 putative secreted Zn-dependent protease [Streptomyces zagrosensis]
MDMDQLDWQRAVPDGEDLPEYLEVAAGPDGRIYMRESRTPDKVVITTQAKWDAFIKGVKAGEFDDFVE